ALSPRRHGGWSCRLLLALEHRCRSDLESTPNTAAGTVWGGLDEWLGRIDARAPSGCPDRRGARAIDACNIDARDGGREAYRSGRDADRPIPRLAFHPARLHRQASDHGLELPGFGHLRGSGLRGPGPGLLAGLPRRAFDASLRSPLPQADAPAVPRAARRDCLH